MIEIHAVIAVAIPILALVAGAIIGACVRTAS